MSTTRYRLRTVTFSVHEASAELTACNTPEAAVAYLRPIFAGMDADREHFVILTLDTKNHVRGFKVVSSGGRAASLVDPKTLFRDALALGASSLILAHNHPSGDPDPSPEDRALTLKLVQCGKLLEMPVHDHIILGDGSQFVSLAAMGFIS